jgi:ABC-type phosphate/phosphonate transport system ATPase subunit
VPYTNAIIDLCQPFKLNIALIGQAGSGKSTLIESVANLLMDFKSNQEYFLKKGYGTGSFGLDSLAID